MDPDVLSWLPPNKPLKLPDFSQHLFERIQLNSIGLSFLSILSLIFFSDSLESLESHGNIKVIIDSKICLLLQTCPPNLQNLKNFLYLHFLAILFTFYRSQTLVPRIPFRYGVSILGDIWFRQWRHLITVI